MKMSFLINFLLGTKTHTHTHLLIHLIGIKGRCMGDGQAILYSRANTKLKKKEVKTTPSKTYDFNPEVTGGN